MDNAVNLHEFSHYVDNTFIKLHVYNENAHFFHFHKSMRLVNALLCLLLISKKHQVGDYYTNHHRNIYQQGSVLLQKVAYVQNIHHLN